MPRPIPQPIDPQQVAELAMQVMRRDRFPYLATVDGNQPRVRPVSPVLTEGFTVFVANLRGYHKTVEIAANPKVELCYLDEHHDQVRISGTAEVVTDPEILQRVWDTNPLLREYLGSIESPDLVLYRVRPSRVRFMREWALEYAEVHLEVV
jgi:general stress protein 26